LATRTRCPSGEIGEQDVRVLGVVWLDGFRVDERADRDGELEILAAGARAVRAHAVLPGLGVGLRMVPVIDEGVDVRARDEVYRAAVTAVAAAGAAARHELLAAERETAAPAVARFDVNVDFVDEQVIRAAGC